jgi:hypothetical protein
MRVGAGLCAAAAILAAFALTCGRGSTADAPGDESAAQGGSAGESPDSGVQDGGAAPDGGGTSQGGGPDAGPPQPPQPPPPPVLSAPAAADVERHPGPALVGASFDEEGFLWGVSSDALWLLRPGKSSWERYPNAKSGGVLGNGHQNDGIYSVAGGAAHEAWIGYRGLFFNNNENDDPTVVPESIRTSGGADHIVATFDGIALVDHLVFWTPAGVLKNEPLGRRHQVGWWDEP